MNSVRRLASILLAAVAAFTFSLFSYATPSPRPTGTWQTLGALLDVREGASATALDDGRVLVAGGRNAESVLASAEVLAEGGASTMAAPMHVARRGHTATMLDDGRVLVTGGYGADGVALASAEIFTPGANAWTLVPMQHARAAHTATRTGERGLVVVTGGLSAGAATATIEVFDPATDQFAAFGSMLQTARSSHGAASLADGRVLIVGGASGPAVLASSEIVDTVTGAVSAGPSMATERTNFSATDLLNGDVLVAGGITGGDQPQELASAEKYSAAMNQFVPVGGLPGARQGHQALRLPSNAGVLVVGGTAYGHRLQLVDLFLPETQAFRSVSSSNHLHTDGVFAAGGEGVAVAAGGTGTAAIEGFHFATVTTDKDDYAPGQLVTITGSGWTPNEPVTLVLKEGAPIHADRTFSATADANGNIVNTDFVPEMHHIGVRFFLTAYQGASEAQHTFTDARVINSVTLNDALVVTVSPGASITAKVTVTTDGSGSNTRWRSTAWRISTTPPGALTCVEHDDHDVNGTFTEQFAITAPSAGSYNAYFVAYANDACGGGSPSAIYVLTGGVIVDGGFPSVSSIQRGSASPSNASSVVWNVTFSENVAGVDAAAFAFSETGVSDAVVTGVSGSGSAYTITVDTGSGTGSLGLNLNDNDTIVDTAGNKLGGIGTGVASGGGTGNGSFTGQVYSINRTLTPAITAESRVYDGTADATILTRTLTSSLSISGFDLELTGGSATFSNKHVGTGKTVTATGLMLDGDDASRFVLSSTSATASADITAKHVTGAFMAANKTYDGMTVATVVSRMVVGAIGGDDVSLTGGTAAFADANAGTGKTVTLTGAALSGTDQANYILDSVGDATANIDKADATIDVDGYTDTYDGQPHGATGTATGVLGESLGGLNLGASFTNVPGGTANWTFTDVTGNYNNANGSVAVVINKADATIDVDGFTGTYDGAAHGATGTATGVLGESLAGLNLGASFTNVPGGTANWTFTDVTGNYNNASGTAAIVINKADATIDVDGFTGTYDGQAHGATGTATGVLGESLAGLNLGASFTNVPGGTANWTFTDVTGNYNNASGTASIVITKANATISVTGYTGVYDGAAHGATGTATGVLSEALAGLNLGASFTNVPGGTANWTFTDVTGNYNDTSGTATIVITKANATISVDGYTGVYDGAAHGATGSATGVLNEPLAGLDLGASFTNVPGGTANWTFTDVTGNYNNANGSVAIVINKADATVDVDGYTGTYDGLAHGATGTATGVQGESLAGLNLGASFTNVPGGTANWTFTDVTGNYNNANGSVAIVINKADAAIDVDGYTGTYDGLAHGATGTATGVQGESLAGLNLGASFTNVPGGTANWTFTDVTGNYNNGSGTAAIVITKADATIDVDGYTGTYDGQAHGATGTATGVLGEPLAGLSLGASFTDVPGGTANWTFTDTTGNYNNASGAAVITIDKASTTTAVTCPASVEYNSPAQTPCSANVTGAGGLSQSLTVSYLNNTDAGSASASASYAGGPNHQSSNDTESFTIAKRLLTVTANDKSKLFGAADPMFDASYAGLVGGQGAGVLDSPVTCSAAEPHNLAGSYAIACTAGLDNNYSLLFVPGTLTVTGYVFAGFFQPIDNTVNVAQKVWNSTKAGQAVPVKWRLTLGGAPVSSLPSFESVYSMQVSCGTGGDMVNAIEEGTTGASGLQYLGDGNFHYNWKTPNAYKNTCRAMYVKFNDGSISQIAYFTFK